MLFRVVKTGMEMFDACRAYGLSLVLSTVSEIEDIQEKVTLQDYGSYYQIEGPQVDGKDLSREQNWLELFIPTDGWARIFLTAGGSPTLQIKKEEKKKKVEEKIKKKTGEISKTLESNLQDILTRYSRVYIPELTTIGKNDFGTLYQSLEGAASKGFRRQVRDRYEEGGQIYAPMDDLAMAYLGGAKFIRWVRGKSMIGILPLPQYIELINYLEIQKLLESKFVNYNVSVTSSIAHYAVLFAQRIREKKASQESYADKYSSLVFNAMVKTGNQWKPVSGGIFPMELLFSLIESDLHISEEVFSIWDNVFRTGNMKGNEDLAQTLAEFITHPSLDLFEDHVKVQLRYLIKKKARAKTYSENCIREVMRFVG